MPKQKRPVCDGNCFACPYPDCICDDPPKQDERTLARETDRAASVEDMTREAKRVAAAKKAYYEAHREEVAAAKKAYYEAHREEVAAAQKAYYEAHRDYYLNYARAYRKRIKEAEHEA